MCLKKCTKISLVQIIKKLLFLNRLAMLSDISCYHMEVIAL